MRLLKIIAATIILYTLIPLHAHALSAIGVFTSAPANIFPLLDRNARLDMYDYFKGGFDTPTANTLKGESRITALTPMSVKINMTPSSECEIVLLPTTPGDTILAVINTILTPVPDSHITFYDRDWNELPAKKIISQPALKDWLNQSGKKNIATVTSMIPFILTSYSYDPDKQTLTMTDNTGKFLSEDVYTLVKPYLLNEITYLWTGKKFNRQ